MYTETTIARVPSRRNGYRSGMAMSRASRYEGGAVARANIARVVTLVATVVAAILVLGILLVLLDANRSNDIVQTVHDAAEFLAGPFKGLFDLDRPRVQTAVNWGIAAVVWFALGRLIARLILR
jgi:hypothetical protein